MFLETKSQTEKAYKDTKTNHTRAESHHSQFSNTSALYSISPRPNFISGASHPERILVVFLVPPVDVWMAGQTHIRPRLLPYGCFLFHFSLITILGTGPELIENY